MKVSGDVVQHYQQQDFVSGFRTGAPGEEEGLILFYTLKAVNIRVGY